MDNMSELYDVEAQIKSLRWILGHIPDKGKGTFEGAVHFYVGDAIQLLTELIYIHAERDRLESYTKVLEVALSQIGVKCKFCKYWHGDEDCEYALDGTCRRYSKWQLDQVRFGGGEAKWKPRHIISATTLMFAIAITPWAIGYAYAARGYSAIGGEYLIIPLSLVIVYIIQMASKEWG